jgi:antagonist of KipI
MTMRVLLGGPLTTIQDLGRRGAQRDGVPEGGAMDTVAARIANLLVGNDEHAAVLESTLAGPALLFERAAVVALGGGDFAATLDGEPMHPWHAFPVRAGATLALGNARHGCRAYIAIGGGIDVPLVLGSRSTCLPARFGGHEGRPLRAGDVLRLRESPAQPARRGLAASLRPAYDQTVRLIAGAHQPLLDPVSYEALFGSGLRVSQRSDRMGYRLEGVKLALRAPVELLSAGVAIGTLQLPPGGEPILLMADHQTTGGYPIIGHVATVDLGAVAQLRPGDGIRLAGISLDEAQRLYLERERSLDAVRRALSFPA